MEFLSPEVQECAALFHRTGFGEARIALQELLDGQLHADARLEGEALLLRIRIERDEVDGLEELRARAIALVAPARATHLGAALYHLGIVCLLCEDPESADLCFRAAQAEARNEEERALALYGLAAVLHNRKESAAAVRLLDELRERPLSPDTSCLVQLLKGNCLRALGRLDTAQTAYLQAQKTLAAVKDFYLKNWVFFGLAIIHARRGEPATARTLFEVVLSITHPLDFKRLHKLASDELARLETKAEVLFDPVTGDIVSARGYLCLRRKPTLISILTALMERWPDPVSKERMYQRVWAGEYHPLRHDGLIYSHMQRLRQILHSDMQLNDFVQTVAEGYRLNPKIPVKLRDEAPQAMLHPPPREACYEQ